jgi:hypothetical protein
MYTISGDTAKTGIKHRNSPMEEKLPVILRRKGGSPM